MVVLATLIDIWAFGLFEQASRGHIAHGGFFTPCCFNDNQKCILGTLDFYMIYSFNVIG